MRIRALVALLVMMFGILTPEARAETRRKKIWRVSAAVLGAVTIADMQSSMGRPELNGMLRSPDGRFGSRGVALKSLVVGGAIGGQWLLLRKNPEAAGHAAGINFAMSAVTGAVVVRNRMLK
jgi:hypothetical protein